MPSKAAEPQMRGFPHLVLFDLDGTLVDSAPDFVATINGLRAERGVPAIALSQLRPHVSKGARAMLAAGFPRFDEQTREAMIPEFLRDYQAGLGRHGKAFDGVEALLCAIEAAGSRWGIVTNKPEYLARQLLPLLNWDARCAILIGGDTLAARKPDPLPLLHATRQLGIAVHDSVYIGDDERDIAAARAAGMASIVALWGYRSDAEDPFAWHADALAGSPSDLIDPAAWPRRQ